MRSRRKNDRSRRKMSRKVGGRRKGVSVPKRRTPKQCRIRKRSIMRGGAEPELEPEPEPELGPDSGGGGEPEPEPELGLGSGETRSDPSRSPAYTTDINVTAAQDDLKRAIDNAAKVADALRKANLIPIQLNRELANAIINVERLCVVCNPMDSGEYPGEIHKLSFPGTVKRTRTSGNTELQARLMIFRKNHNNGDTTYNACITNYYETQVLTGYRGGGELDADCVKCEPRSWFRLKSSAQIQHFAIYGTLCGSTSVRPTQRVPQVDIEITTSEPTKLLVIFKGIYEGIEYTEQIYFTPDPKVLHKILGRENPLRQEFSRGSISEDYSLVRAVFQPILDSLEKLGPIMVSNNIQNLSIQTHRAKSMVDFRDEKIRRICECSRGGHKFIRYEKISREGSHSEGEETAPYHGPTGVCIMRGGSEYSPPEYSHQLSCACGCRELYIRGKAEQTKQVVLEEFNQVVERDMNSVGLQAAKQRLAFAIGSEQYRLTPALILYITTLTNSSVPLSRSVSIPSIPLSTNPSYMLLKSCLSDIRYNTCLHKDGYLVDQRVMVGGEDFEEAIGYMKQLLLLNNLTKEQIIKGLTIFMVTVKKVNGLFAVYSRFCYTVDSFQTLFPEAAEDPSVNFSYMEDTSKLYSYAFKQYKYFCDCLKEEQEGDSKELQCLEAVINIRANTYPKYPPEENAIEVLRATCSGSTSGITERTLLPEESLKDIFNKIDGSYVFLSELYEIMCGEPDILKRVVQRRKAQAAAMLIQAAWRGHAAKSRAQAQVDDGVGDGAEGGA